MVNTRSGEGSAKSDAQNLADNPAILQWVEGGYRKDKKDFYPPMFPWQASHMEAPHIIIP